MAFGLLNVVEALIGPKYEDFVFNHRTARRRAELILFFDGNARREKVARVQIIVS